MVVERGLLLVSHSSRPVEPARCNAGFLRRRYADPDRLQALPAFDSLPPANTFNVRYGSLSLMRMLATSRGPRLQHFAFFTAPNKIQHAVALDARRLLVCFEDHLELYAADTSLMSLRGNISRKLRRVSVIEHPLFAGLHNAVPLDDTRVAVSASAPDAVLILDVASGEVERLLRMPETIYGQNYPIELSTDVNSHYIHNDLQTTHLNWVSRDESGRLLVSALIPGAIGEFSVDGGDYREIARSFVGCHGARRLPDGSTYFADSSNGDLVVLDALGGEKHRLALGSSWLHDVQYLGDSLFACAVADRNAVVVMDLDRGVAVAQKRFRRCLSPRLEKYCHRYAGWLGNSLQFFSFHPELRTGAA